MSRRCTLRILHSASDSRAPNRSQRVTVSQVSTSRPLRLTDLCRSEFDLSPSTSLHNDAKFEGLQRLLHLFRVDVATAGSAVHSAASRAADSRSLTRQLTQVVRFHALNRLTYLHFILRCHEATALSHGHDHNHRRRL
ncbi:hypothetical protein SCLCIDRAFT_954669 [Scleroderma citrinum Foug A]|uniref:Uncharacterized protein n=1 Tax=Scleroderma citrinum Foug A TaxID=1036808 RepID=A0A0C3E6P5_9AGAM|nr:hypothetical protein SCLCIDRAFT_954669 [Scleroderma citrinum Foug A]